MTNDEYLFSTPERAAAFIAAKTQACIRKDCALCPMQVPCFQPEANIFRWLEKEADRWELFEELYGPGAYVEEIEEEPEAVEVIVEEADEGIIIIEVETDPVADKAEVIVEVEPKPKARKKPAVKKAAAEQSEAAQPSEEAPAPKRRGGRISQDVINTIQAMAASQQFSYEEIAEVCKVSVPTARRYAQMVAQ